MYSKTLLEIHTTLNQIKDAYREMGRNDLERGLSMACLLIKETYMKAIDEGRTGDQESDRKYASLKETQGPTMTPRKDKPKF